jgi:hypothetical protein
VKQNKQEEFPINGSMASVALKTALAKLEHLPAKFMLSSCDTSDVDSGRELKNNIKTIGIPKVFKCPNCHRKNYRTKEQRHNMAECIIANSAGLWCLEECSYCWWVAKIYPSAINGIPCTHEECDRLFEEMKQYGRSES